MRLDGTTYYNLDMKQLQVVFVLLIAGITPYIHAQDEEFILEKIKDHDLAVLGVAFHPSGKYLATCSEDKTTKIWNLTDFSEVITLEGHFQEVNDVAFYSNGNKLLTAGDRSIRIWSTETWKEEKVLTGHHTYVWSVNIDPSLKYLASGSFDKQPRIWNIAKEESVQLEGHDKSVLATAISPDGRHVASGSLDETIRLWDMKTNKLIKVFEGHSDNIYEIKFTSDSEHFVSVSRDKTVRLWSIKQGGIIKTYPGHRTGVMTVDISTDDNFMLTGSFDGEVKLWELATSAEIYTYTHHEKAVTGVRFSPDFERFATSSMDETAVIWNLNKKVFVDYHSEEAFLQELEQSELFLPKQKDESRSDYKLREEKAAQYKKKLYSKFFNAYLTELNKKKTKLLQK
jgi:WD40 repeat protein